MRTSQIPSVRSHISAGDSRQENERTAVYQKQASNDTRTDEAMIMTWGVGRSDAKDGNLEEKILRRADWGMIGQAAAV